MPRTSRLGWTAAIMILYILHQDWPLWAAARPLVLAFLPVGLAYHAAYCVAVAALMWALTRWAWPSGLEHAGDISASGSSRRQHHAPEENHAR